VAIVEVNGTRIAYDRRDENASGPPVVFLHAFPLNRMMWEPQFEELGGNFDVIAPDMRGHGASDLNAETVTMEQMADDVFELATSLELGPLVLVGLSMGGYVALAFAKKYPEALRALVLADTRSTADDEKARENRYAMIDDVAANGPASLAEKMLPKLLSEKTVEEDQELVVSVRRMIETTSPAGIAGALAGMAAREDTTDILPAIAVPTLVIVGEQDAVTPPADAEALAAAIPGARLERLSGAAHLTNLERAAEFNALLKEFVGGLDGGE
jgi:3-oxoadipate enol-lactonase